VPQFRWCGNWQKLLQKNQLPLDVLRWIKERLHANKQALVFFPHIKLMEKVLPILRQFDPNIEAVHAEDPERKEKVQKMRANEVPILLTTTILERGVTFPNIDVAIVGAEDDIFTESALVQIAGRAGRSKDYPDGVVTFFHYGKTEAMLRARKQIITMNREGIKRGLIR
jgi:competence protein ComFA